MAATNPRRRLSAVQVARDAIHRVRRAGTTLAHATAQEAALVRQKAGRKQEAIRRMMATENPLIPGKAYTCTAAESVLETDGDYAGFLQQVTAATVASSSLGPIAPPPGWRRSSASPWC